MPRDIPILFSAPMVRALLDGRKTQTRRLAWSARKVKEGRVKNFDIKIWADKRGFEHGIMPPRGSTPGFYYVPSSWQSVLPGDRLWVRENLCQRQGEFLGMTQNVMEARYSADGAEVLNEHGFNLLPWWKGTGGLPCIHMPRWASRLTLTVRAVRLVRLDSISEQDAISEGVETDPESLPQGPHYCTRRGDFIFLWEKLHGPGSWSDNPQVIALNFTVEKRNIDQVRV